MPLSTIPCVLFAGGKSSRMGEDKAFLPFGGYDSLSQYQVERLKKIFAKVYISVKEPAKFSNIDCMVIEDILYPDISAPTTGFLNILKQLKKANSFFVLSVDTPFVSENIISKLIEASQNLNYDAYIIRTPSGVHPLCGIYTRALEESIKMMMKKGEYKLMKLLESCNVHYEDIEDEESLLNLNTPEEYKRALKLLKA